MIVSQRDCLSVLPVNSESWGGWSVCLCTQFHSTVAAVEGRGTLSPVSRADRGISAGNLQILLWT